MSYRVIVVMWKVVLCTEGLMSVVRGQVAAIITTSPALDLFRIVELVAVVAAPCANGNYD